MARSAVATWGSTRMRRSCGAKVELTANPNPTSAFPSSGVSYTIVGDANHPDQAKPYPWQTQFTVVMSETAGVGPDITAISVKVQQAAGGIITPPTNGDVERYQFTSQSRGTGWKVTGRPAWASTCGTPFPTRGEKRW